MALSMDEERLLAEIERRLADEDPVLAARLTSFRLPRLALGPRSQRGRLTASLLMLVVVAAVSVFVYALVPFRGQPGGNPATGGTRAHSTASASTASTSPTAIRPSVRTVWSRATIKASPAGRSGSSAATAGRGK